MKTSELVLSRYRRFTKVWLLVCIVMVLGMVAIGGYTRLSGSGLSITQWAPVTGIVPPMSEAAWNEAFEGYQKIPQYKLVNDGMTLEQFKTIFWPEYWHRLKGRLLGIVFFVPLAWLACRRALRRDFAWQLLGIFALGGAQGLMGWIMVHSGLTDDAGPYVAPVKLAVHLMLALLILSLLLIQYARVAHMRRTVRLSLRTSARWGYAGLLALLVVQILFGALMAGMHAGLLYPTYPLMGEALVPPEWLALSPWWRNVLENGAFVQFVHRWVAIVLSILLLRWIVQQWQALQRLRVTRRLARVVLSIMGVQIVLGVATLLSGVALPVALLHQWTGACLLAAMVLLGYHVFSNKTQSLMHA